MITMPSASTEASLALLSPTSLDSAVLICCGTVYGTWLSQASIAAKAVGQIVIVTIGSNMGTGPGGRCLGLSYTHINEISFHPPQTRRAGPAPIRTRPVSW